MSQPTITDQKIRDLILKHKLYLVGAYISSQALRLLMFYSRERATKGRQLTLEDIVIFEPGRAECE